jgi:hypothetical protein
MDVDLHPSADLAVLSVLGPQVDPFPGVATKYAMGDEFFAFGFPADVFGPGSLRPTARLFRGYFQRYFEYASPLGYTYNAGEMSVPSPGGLSGGPVLRLADGPFVSGLAAENLKTYTVLEAEEEVATPAGTMRREYREVINYGVAVLLDSVYDWLKVHIPGLPPLYVAA